MRPRPRAKLSAGDVLAIRRQRADGASLRVLAAAFGVSTSSISRVALRLTWYRIKRTPSGVLAGWAFTENCNKKHTTRCRREVAVPCRRGWRWVR